MKFYFGLVLWCTVNIVISGQQDAIGNNAKQPPLQSINFENFDTNKGLNNIHSEFVTDGRYTNYTISRFDCHDSHSSIPLK